ncbi:hypothetical protein ACNKHR_17955 [Shigella flexneri]
MATKPWPDRIVDGAAGHFIKSGKTRQGRFSTLLPLTLLFVAIFYGGDICRTLVANGAIPLIPGLWLVPGLMLMGLLMLVARDFTLLQKFSR